MSGVRPHILLCLKVAVSLALLLLLYRNTPVQQIAAVLAQCQLLLLLPVGLLLLLNTTLSVLKWRLLLLSDHIDIPLIKLVASYLIAAFFNLFLPSNIGGDSYRIYDIMQKSGRGASTAASVLADRLSGFVALACLSLGGSVFVAIRLERPVLVILPLLALAALALILVLLWLQRPLLRLLQVLRLDRMPRMQDFCGRFFAAFARYGAEPRMLAWVLLISFAFQFLLVVAVYLMAWALHAHAPFVYFLAFVPLITLMEALPVSVYGIGVRDMGYVFFFQWAGMGEAYTRSLAVVFLAVTFCYSLIGGLLYAGRIFAAGRRARDGQAGSS